MKRWADAEEALIYELNEDGGSYTVRGLDETHLPARYVLTIPPTWAGKPVTSIGDWAFSSCAGLTEATIPDSIRSIGDDAFLGTAYYCDARNWQAGLLYIGRHLIRADASLTGARALREGTLVVADQAFRHCTGLTRITIPRGVGSIGRHAFSACTGLVSVTIPESVTEIGDGAFQGCCKLVEVYNLSSLPIERGSWESGGVGYYAHVIHATAAEASIVTETAEGYRFLLGEGDVCLLGYGGDQSRLHLPDAAPNGESYVIGDYAFYHDARLIGVQFSTGVRGIGRYAFSACEALTEVDLPDDGLRSIGEYAFSACSRLGAVKIPRGVTALGSHAFAGCGALTKVCFRADGALERIGDAAFSACASLRALTIPAGVKALEADALADCTRLAEITLPASVTEIGTGALRGCSALTRIEVSEGNPCYCSAGDALVAIGTRTLIVGTRSGAIPADGSVARVGAYAFADCAGLTDMTIPASVREIGAYAFANCTSLLTVAFAAGSRLCRVDAYAFSGCTKLSVLPLPIGVERIGDYACDRCESLTELRLPPEVTALGTGAFRGCTALRHLTLPDGLVRIGNDVLSGTPYERDDKFWTGDLLYVGRHLIRARTSCAGVCEIRGGTRTVADYAFSDCTSLRAAEIPVGVIRIGAGAFLGCTALTDVTMSESVQEIGSAAFRGCAGLIRFTVPPAVIALGQHAFQGCKSLASVIFRTTPGWYYAWREEDEDGTALDVTDPAENARILTGGYDFYWKRKE